MGKESTAASSTTSRKAGRKPTVNALPEKETVVVILMNALELVGKSFESQVKVVFDKDWKQVVLLLPVGLCLCEECHEIFAKETGTKETPKLCPYCEIKEREAKAKVLPTDSSAAGGG